MLSLKSRLLQNETLFFLNLQRSLNAADTTRNWIVKRKRRVQKVTTVARFNYPRQISANEPSLIDTKKKKKKKKKEREGKRGKRRERREWEKGTAQRGKGRNYLSGGSDNLHSWSRVTVWNPYLLAGSRCSAHPHKWPDIFRVGTCVTVAYETVTVRISAI